MDNNNIAYSTPFMVEIGLTKYPADEVKAMLAGWKRAFVFPYPRRLRIWRMLKSNKQSTGLQKLWGVAKRLWPTIVLIALSTVAKPLTVLFAAICLCPIQAAIIIVAAISAVEIMRLVAAHNLEQRYR